MCFAMGEFAMKLNIPDEVLEHPSIKIMEDCANDVVVLSNVSLDLESGWIKSNS